jgi:hypothetical protein
MNSLSDGTFFDAANTAPDLAALKNTIMNPPTSFVFDQFASDFYHGPQNYDCGLVDGVCDAGVQCLQADTPAGFVILESLSGLHSVRGIPQF